MTYRHNPTQFRRRLEVLYMALTEAIHPQGYATWLARNWKPEPISPRSVRRWGSTAADGCVPGDDKVEHVRKLERQVGRRARDRARKRLDEWRSTTREEKRAMGYGTVR